MEMARKMSEMIALDSTRRSSLPPRVDGNLSGYLIMKINEITWHQKPQCSVKVYVSWWGDSQTAIFYPSDKQSRLKNLDEDTTYVYNILTSIKLFESYLKDCEILTLKVHEKDTDALIGSAEVKNLCMIISEQSHHSYYVVSNKHGNVIADLHVHFSLKVFPCAYKKFIQKKHVPQTINSKARKKVKIIARDVSKEAQRRHAESEQTLHFNTPRTDTSSRSDIEDTREPHHLVNAAVLHSDVDVSNEMISHLLEESQNIRKDLKHSQYSQSREIHRDFLTEEKNSPERKTVGSQFAAREAKILNYVLGKEMNDEEEAEAIQALKETSPITSFVELADGFNKDIKINTNRVELNGDKRFDLPQTSLNVYEESKVLLKELKEMKNKMKRETKPVQHSDMKPRDTCSKVGVSQKAKYLRVTVQTLSLNYVGVQRVCLTSQTTNSFQHSRSHCDRLPPGVVYFVEYEIPFCLFSQSSIAAKKKPWISKLHRFCSRQRFGKCVNFYQHKVHVLACTKPGFLELLTDCCLTFKVYSRYLNQRVPALLGEALLSLAEIIESSTLSKVVELSILPQRTAPRNELSLGILKVKIEFGSNRLFCERNTIVSNISQHDTSSSKSETGSEEEASRDSRLTHSHKAKSQEIVGLKRHTATLVEKDARGLLKTGRNRSASEESKKKSLDNKTLEARSMELSHEKRTLLYGLLHIPKGRGMPVTSTYLICRAFWKEDVMTSDVCWETGDPHYAFHEVLPVLLSLELLDRCYNNFMITEVWSKNELIGIAKMPLHQFYIAYRDPAVVDQLMLSKYPIVGVDGWINVVNPLSRRPVGQLNVVLAMGTENQIQMLEMTRCLKDALRPPPIPPSLAVGPEVQNITTRNMQWPDDLGLNYRTHERDFSKDLGHSLGSSLYNKKAPHYSAYDKSMKQSEPVITSSESSTNALISETTPPTEKNKVVFDSYQHSRYTHNSTDSSPRVVFSNVPVIESDSTSSEATSPRKGQPAPQLPPTSLEERLQEGLGHNTQADGLSEGKSYLGECLLNRNRHNGDKLLDFCSTDSAPYLTNNFQRRHLPSYRSESDRIDQKEDSSSRETMCHRTHPMRLVDLTTVEEDDAEDITSPREKSLEEKLREDLRNADLLLEDHHSGDDLITKHFSHNRPQPNGDTREIDSTFSTPREVDFQRILSGSISRQKELQEKLVRGSNSDQDIKEPAKHSSQNDCISSCNLRQGMAEKTRADLMDNDETSRILDLLQELNINQQNNDVHAEKDSHDLHEELDIDAAGRKNAEYDLLHSPTKSRSSGKSSSSSPCTVLNMSRSHRKSSQQIEEALKSLSGTSVLTQTENNYVQSSPRIEKFHACIEVTGAVHLSEVCKNQPPSCYITIPATDSMLVSPVVPKTCNPVWNWTCETLLPVSLLQNVSKRLILKVWHKKDFSYKEVNPVQDLVIGFVPIDLTLLLLDLPCIAGWFNICDFSGYCKGQIAVSVTPMEDVAQFKENLQESEDFMNHKDKNNIPLKKSVVDPSVDNSVKKNQDGLHHFPNSDLKSKGELKEFSALHEISSQSTILTIDCDSPWREEEFHVTHNQGRTLNEEYLSDPFQSASSSFLSRTLKQKLSELDEMTQRMKNRLVTGNNSWLVQESLRNTSKDNVKVLNGHSWRGNIDTENQPSFQRNSNSEFQKKISEVLRGDKQRSTEKWHRNMKEDSLLRNPISQSKHGSKDNISVTSIGGSVGGGSSCQEDPTVSSKCVSSENVSADLMASTEKLMNEALKEMELENVFNPLLFQHILSCYQNGQQIKKAVNQCASVLSMDDPEVSATKLPIKENTLSEITLNRLVDSSNQNLKESSFKTVATQPNVSASVEGEYLCSRFDRDGGKTSPDKKTTSSSLHTSSDGITSLNLSSDRLLEERENTCAVSLNMRGGCAVRHSGESTNTGSSPSSSFVSGQNYDLIRSTPSGISTEGGDLEFLDGKMLNIKDKLDTAQEGSGTGEVSLVVLKVGNDESDSSVSSSDTYVVDVRRQAPDGGDPFEDRSKVYPGKNKQTVPSKIKKSSIHSKV